jgi:hypothetical protein
MLILTSVAYFEAQLQHLPEGTEEYQETVRVSILRSKTSTRVVQISEQSANRLTEMFRISGRI